MAIYAFDGTTNEYHGQLSPENTNIVRFLEYHAGADAGESVIGVISDDEEYINGVGTRLHGLGRVIGGFTGAGGRTRVRELEEKFRENWANGDQIVDVIGFSRGAALALHFCNKLAEGIQIGQHKIRPEVRFLGLWDTVPAFGLPGVLIDLFKDLDPGWKLSVPPNVRACCHAMALDEDRQAFQVHRPRVTDPHQTSLQEMWFKGTHGDVGGAASGLSSLTLHWMIEQARACGLSFPDQAVAQVKALCDPEQPSSKSPFSGDIEYRVPHPGDLFHPSAATPLEIGEQREVEVHAALKFNLPDILIEPQGSYVFEFDPQATWVDLDIQCTPSGWPDDLPEQDPGILDKFEWMILKSYFFSNFRRVPAANWFELTVCVEHALDSAVAIGHGQHSSPQTPWRPDRPGRLALFANDAESRYDNNHGSLRVRVRRTG